MKKVYAALAAAKNRPRRVSRSEAAPVAPNDTTVTPPDSLVTPPDTLVIPNEVKESPDSLVTPPDSLVTPPDTLAAPDTLAPAPRVPSKYEIRRQQQKARQAAKDSVYQAKQAAREARWAVADSIDAAKAAVKEQKKQERKAARDEKARLGKEHEHHLQDIIACCNYHTGEKAHKKHILSEFSSEGYGDKSNYKRGKGEGEPLVILGQGLPVWKSSLLQSLYPGLCRLPFHLFHIPGDIPEGVRGLVSVNQCRWPT